MKTKEATFLNKAKNYLFVGIILLFVLAISFSDDNKKKISPDEIKYNFTQASVTFFKNLRTLYYDIEEIPEGKLFLYRHKKRSQVKDKSISNILVLDYRLNRAYLRLSREDLAEDELLRVSIEGRDTLCLKAVSNVQEEYIFMAKVYNAILDEQKILIHTAQGSAPLFKKEAHKNAFRVTFLDYARVVQHIR